MGYLDSGGLERYHAGIKALIEVQSVYVTGRTPSIEAGANRRYVCGEVEQVSFSPCSTGVCDVLFTSGSPAAVLVLPNGVKFPEWFDAKNLVENTIYEINILDGRYGAVMTWPA